jgi:hypothetical protein
MHKFWIGCKATRTKKYHATDKTNKKKIMMTSASSIPFRGASSTGSRTASNVPSVEFGMTKIHALNDGEGGNNVDILHDIEDENTSFNDSNGGEGNTCRSTSTGGWHSDTGDDSRLTTRREELASNETRAVTKLKLLVFGSLFFSMVAVVFAAYYLTSKAEHDNFELHFQDDANKLLANIGQNLQRTMEASDAFITSITSYAAHTNQTWPYVVIPDFSVRAEKIRSLCGAVYATTYHFVENEQRKDWENFTATVGTEMVDEAIAAIADYGLMDWPISSNYSEWNVIFDYDEYDKENKVRCTAIANYILRINPAPYTVDLHVAGRRRCGLRWSLSSTLANSTHHF